VLRLRCPNQGCLLELPDEMMGQRARCPHCEQFLVVESRLLVETGVSASPLPSFDLGPKEKRAGAAAGNDTSVYAGLPPLAVMLGIRKGRGRDWQGDAALRAQMCPGGDFFADFNEEGIGIPISLSRITAGSGSWPRQARRPAPRCGLPQFVGGRGGLAGSDAIFGRFGKRDLAACTCSTKITAARWIETPSVRFSKGPPGERLRASSFFRKRFSKN
jgi:hypothetical protein